MMLATQRDQCAMMMLIVMPLLIAVEATRASPVKRSAGGFADEDDLFDM